MYEFVLTFALPSPDADPADYLDSLFEQGCDDATIGVGTHGMIALDFSREALDAASAMASAIEAVARAIPGAKLIESKPDLVNLSEIAELVGCTRQNIRKYASREVPSVKARFPDPFVTGSANLWSFYEVGSWLSRYAAMKLRPEVLEVSRAAAAINLEVRNQRSKQLLSV